MNPPTDLERMAALEKGLTPKMRFNILSAREAFNGDYLTRAWMHMREQSALRSRGLSEPVAFHRDRLTSDGISLRNHIMKGQADDQVHGRCDPAD